MGVLAEHKAMDAKAAQRYTWIFIYLFDWAAFFALLMGAPPMPLAIMLFVFAFGGVFLDFVGAVHGDWTKTKVQLKAGTLVCTDGKDGGCPIGGFVMCGGLTCALWTIMHPALEWAWRVHGPRIYCNSPETCCGAPSSRAHVAGYMCADEGGCCCSGRYSC